MANNVSSGEVPRIEKNRRSIVCERKHGLRQAARVVARPTLAIAFLSAIFVFVAAGGPAQAQTYTVLHSFNGTDGAFPEDPLIMDGAGNLYGTTAGAFGFNDGTVFKLIPASLVLHTFAGADGSTPYAGLIRDAQGNLYGTTKYGGTYGNGTVFELTPSGTEIVLHNFTGGADGGYPFATLVADTNGTTLYGTTAYGGAFGYGTVFVLLIPGKVEGVLYNFTGGQDGSRPYAGLVRDALGNLYGTTCLGGVNGYGTVFEVTLSGVETVLYSFTGGQDGANPYAGLIRDSQGTLYGTTSLGGVYGVGTVFEVFVPSGQERVLHSFAGHGKDGANPAGVLVQDSNGILYGTTHNGGAQNDGTAFSLTPSGAERVLHSFTGGADGGLPSAGVILDQQGYLYGTTLDGGAYNYGTVFRLR